MIAIFCGSRHWTDPGPIQEAIKKLPKGSTVIHGCAKGADTIAGKLAEEAGHLVIQFPANWETYGKAAGPRRNKQMLEFLQSQDREEIKVFAFPMNCGSGTKNMIDQASKAGVEVEIHHSFSGGTN